MLLFIYYCVRDIYRTLAAFALVSPVVVQPNQPSQTTCLISVLPSSAVYQSCITWFQYIREVKAMHWPAPDLNIVEMWKVHRKVHVL